jgi:hypothetical protein
MAKTPVMAATGPVELLAGTQQISLPLTALYFEDGELKAAGPLYTAHQADVDTWLQYLSDQGLITAAATPPPKQALLITAKNTGSQGNDIRIALSNVRQDPSDATKQIFDATLTQTDQYSGLTKDAIKAVLGATASFTDGSRPGLVYVSSAGTPDVPKAGTYAPNNTFVVKVPKDGGGNAFELTYRVQDSAATATVEIADVSTDEGTFSLVATWAKTAAGIHVTALGTSFSDHIAVTKPEGGAATDGDVPAPGTVVLAGGADAASAQKASAAVAAAD